MELLAKQVVTYYHIYQSYLQENNLEDDSNSITVEYLIDFVEDIIDDEYRERLEREIGMVKN